MPARPRCHLHQVCRHANPNHNRQEHPLRCLLRFLSPRLPLVQFGGPKDSLDTREQTKQSSRHFCPRRIRNPEMQLTVQLPLSANTDSNACCLVVTCWSFLWSCCHSIRQAVFNLAVHRLSMWWHRFSQWSRLGRSAGLSRWVAINMQEYCTPRRRRRIPWRCHPERHPRHDCHAGTSSAPSLATCSASGTSLLPSSPTTYQTHYMPCRLKPGNASSVRQTLAMFASNPSVWQAVTLECMPHHPARLPALLVVVEPAARIVLKNGSDVLRHIVVTLDRAGVYHFDNISLELPSHMCGLKHNPKRLLYSQSHTPKYPLYTRQTTRL